MIFCDFGSIFRGFGKGLGGILGGIFDYFWWFCRKRRNGVEGHETLRGRMNFEGWLKEKHTNFVKKHQKNDANFNQAKTGPKNLIWERLGLHLGGLGGGFGRDSGSLLGPLGLFLGLFFHACIWTGVQKCSWRHLGKILARFGRVWEGFWEGFGRVLARLGRDF